MTFRFAFVFAIILIGFALPPITENSSINAQIRSLKFQNKASQSDPGSSERKSVLRRPSLTEQEIIQNELVPLPTDFGPVPPNIQALDEFKRAHPGVRVLGAQFGATTDPDAEDKSATRVFGTTLAVGETPIDSARRLVDELALALGTDIGHLVPAIQSDGEFVVGAMTNPVTGEPKLYALRLEQHYNGIPVFRSGAGFVVRNEPGNPVVMSNFDLREFADFEMPEINAESHEISDAMKASVADLFDSNRIVADGEDPDASLTIRYSDQALVIYAGIYNFRRDPEVALVFMAERGSVKTYPDYQKYMVVASVETGKILHAETQIHNVDVQGNVSGRSTLTIRAAECDPETSVNLPYAEVAVIGGNTSFADANGNFNIPHSGTANVTVRSRLSGTYFQVFDQSNGGSIPQLTTVVTPPGPANFLHNPNSASETITANVNAYYHSNIVRDWLVQFEPNFPVIANQTGFDVNTNLNDSCNAFYNGVSINFFTSGSGCNNTSFADVVYHEYGHHIVNTSGNGQDQYGEGYSDCVGVIIEDDPILGHGFQGNCNAGIRNADNSIQYPCTNNGSGHFCGQLISGCVWDTMQELKVTEPNNFQDISAQLLLGMTIIRGQLEPGNGTIEPSIAEMYLVVDDDDANIFNGTPHYAEIDAGFSAHNMDPPDIDLLVFSFPNGRPEFVSPGGGAAFTVEAAAGATNPQSGTGTLHVDSGSGFQSYPMTEVSPNVYEANFPATDCGTVLRYYISAMDDEGNTQLSPRGAPDVTYSVISGVLVATPFDDDFESSTGWTGSGDATDGQWSIGIPAGGGDRGDPPTDGDGSGRCLLTDNVDGNSDVDGGSTIATSPIFDASTGSGQEAIVSYYRWYSNHTGASPLADTFVVEVSNNGGSTWTNLETVGPSGIEAQGGWYFKQFNLGDFVALTNQMQVRFTASDLGSGSVVEAGVDGVKIQVVGCEISLNPSDLEIDTGTLIEGDIAELEASDDDKLIVESTPVSRTQTVQLTVESTSSIQNPSEISFEVESSSSLNRLLVQQEIQMFNFDTNEYESVKVNLINGTDQVRSVLIENNAGRFVQNGTGTIRARLIGRRNPIATGKPGYVLQRALRYRLFVDQITWTVIP